jgi:hypothetical protein
VRSSVAAGRLSGKAKIEVRIGRVVNKYKVAKHFELTVEDRRFEFKILHEKVAAEAALDGIYVIRTNVPKKQLGTADAVRSYKGLCEVERAFRSLKTVDLKIRPIHHRLEDRVRAHIFLCTLAYYVEWHMREAWRELLFADEDFEAKKDRDPVAPAQRSQEALEKLAERTLEDGSPVHRFRTLLQDLATVVRNTCITHGAKTASPAFKMVTTPTDTQHRALQLLQQITV